MLLCGSKSCDVDSGLFRVTSGKTEARFKKDGTTTAGNSSQMSDGAGAVLLMKRSIAMQKGLPILGVFRCELRLCCLDYIENKMVKLCTLG
ncbi:hypothetical protein RHGRI_030001 [Rhododendron griersonianum]|uniref:Thiolase N-terminal domain-containing protein n=1 Tax=Rhododendron griersonianum TaxID=479676 RepID=A0AAV6IQ09_9ERIC|nr:hypothetical protein RHGRI_030001 [Rhododendron griersonianum]